MTNLNFPKPQRDLIATLKAMPVDGCATLSPELTKACIKYFKSVRGALETAGVYKKIAYSSIVYSQLKPAQKQVVDELIEMKQRLKGSWLKQYKPEVYQRCLDLFGAAYPAIKIAGADRPILKQKPISPIGIYYAKPGKPGIIRNIQETHKGLQEPLPIEAFEDITGIEPGRVVHLFTTWHLALEAAGFTKLSLLVKGDYQDPVRPKMSWEWTKEEIVSLVQSATPKELLEIEELLHTNGIAVRRVKKLFGSWGALSTAAGVEFAKAKIGRPLYSTEELIEDIQKVALALKGVPSMNAVREYGKYNPLTVINRFGNWSKALEAAGLTPIPNRFGNARPRDKEKAREKQKRRDERRRSSLLSKAGVNKIVGSQTQMFLTQLISEVIVENGHSGIHIAEHTFEWLINPLTEVKLRLDAYFPGLNLAFEYQSEFHFQSQEVVYEHSLEASVYLDYVKRQLLQEHGITLLEIAFFEKMNKDTIRKKLMSILGGKARACA